MSTQELDEGQEAAQQVAEDDELGLTIRCKAEWEFGRVDVVKKSLESSNGLFWNETGRHSDHEGNIRYTQGSVFPVKD
jgi:hypothetical protein